MIASVNVYKCLELHFGTIGVFISVTTEHRNTKRALCVESQSNSQSQTHNVTRSQSLPAVAAQLMS